MSLKISQQKYYQKNKKKWNKYYKDKYHQNPQNQTRISKERVTFKGKQVQVGFNPRDGVCKLCLKSNLKTVLHHMKYDEDDPLAHTIEVCVGCHNSIHFGKTNIPTPYKIIRYTEKVSQKEEKCLCGKCK